MNTETDTQAEDTALLMEMDEKVNKRVQECLHRILTQDDDLAEWFIRSIINHPKTTKIIKEIYSRQKEADILTAAKQAEYEQMMLQKERAYERYRQGGLANQVDAKRFKTQEEIDYQIRTAKALMANAPTETTMKTPQSMLDKWLGKK